MMNRKRLLDKNFNYNVRINDSLNFLPVAFNPNQNLKRDTKKIDMLINDIDILLKN